MGPEPSAKVDGATGSVAVWTKGFRVSEDTEEFQRVLPVRSQELSLEVEKDIDAFPAWSGILEPLYKLSEYELALQKCLLVRPREVAVIVVGRSEDRHGRPTPVVVSVASMVDWTSPELGRTVSGCGSLASRLCASYSRTFIRNPPGVLSQLRSSQFVVERQFTLDSEPDHQNLDWSSIMATVRRWRGIRGVATPKLVGLGANVLIGTQHEALRAGVRLDGVIDPRDWSLLPLNGNLTLWQPDEEPDLRQSTSKRAGDEPAIKPEIVRLESIDASLKRIDDSLLRVSRALSGMYDLMYQSWIAWNANKRR